MNPKCKLIGISGKIGSGKSYISEKILYPAFDDCIILSFADHMKIDLCSKENIEYERVFIKKDRESRRLLQVYGTEEGRDKYGVDIWIKVMLNWIRLFSDRGIRTIIIPDVRFKNEAQFIKDNNGTLIRVISPKRTSETYVKEGLISSQLHISETDLDNYNDFDCVLYNDAEYDVYQQIKNEKLV